MGDFRVEKPSSSDATAFNYEAGASAFTAKASGSAAFVPMVSEGALESPAAKELGMMNAVPEAIEIANEEEIWPVVLIAALVVLAACGKDKMPGEEDEDEVSSHAHQEFHGDIPASKPVIIHETDTVIQHEVDTVVNVVNPEIITWDFFDIINESLCDGPWEGPDNITGHVKVYDEGLLQYIDIDFSSVSVSDYVQANSKISGRVYDWNNQPVAPGNFDGKLARIELSSGMIEGCNAKYGLLIENPLDAPAPGQEGYSLYVPSNDKTAIYVFGVKFAKGPYGRRVPKVLPVKVDPASINRNSKGITGKGVPDDVPANCNIVIKREQYPDEPGNVRIYQRSSSNGQFFPRAGNFEMTNK